MTQRQVMDDEIDLIELWNILWQGKWVVIAITAVFAVGSVFYALSLPDIYRSEILLAPVTDKTSGGLPGGLPGGLGQLGGLAGLAGINISGGDNQVSMKTRAVATLQSRFFISDFFTAHNLLVPFMGTMPGEVSGTVEIDPELYDEANGQWTRDVSPPRTPAPSDQEVYEVFSELLSVEEDELTGLITVSLEWYDPAQIKNWIDWLIEDINN